MLSKKCEACVFYLEFSQKLIFALLVVIFVLFFSIYAIVCPGFFLPFNIKFSNKKRSPR